MKFGIFSKGILIIAVLFVVLSQVDSVSINRRKSLSASEMEREDESNSKEEKKEEKQKIATLSALLGKEINSTFTVKNSVDFQNLLRVPSLHLSDPQIQDIYMIMSSKKNGIVTQEDMKNFNSLFVTNFEKCDKDNTNLISKEQFEKCIEKDPYLSQIQLPPNVTRSDLSKSLFDIFKDDTSNGGLSFYNYLTLRLVRFAWDKCSVNIDLIDEANFACAINSVSFYKTMSRSATHRLFSIAMKSPRNKIDFVSFSEIAMSLIVFARANSKSDEEISEKEMLISLEHGVLPSRYNKEIINDIFKLTKNDEGNVMDLFSFVFYDKYIRMFEMPFDADKKKKNEMTLSKEEFVNIVTNRTEKRMIEEIDNIITYSKMDLKSFALSEETKQGDKKDEGTFLSMIQKKDSFKSLTKDNKKYKDDDIKKKAERIFNVLDISNRTEISFTKFISFIQFNFVFASIDTKHHYKLTADTLYTKLTTYYDYPMISSSMKKKAQKFSLFSHKSYFDLFNAMLVINIEDLGEAYRRREGVTMMNEVEMKETMKKIGYDMIPDDYMNTCMRGSNERGMHLYEWDCAIINAIRNVIEFQEKQMDYLAVKKYDLKLSKTEFKNVPDDLA